MSRLHEFDDQVLWVREGMARVVPVPLLSLFTGHELETMVSVLLSTLNSLYIRRFRNILQWERQLRHMSFLSHSSFQIPEN